MSFIYIGSHALNQYRQESKPIGDIDMIADIDTAQRFLKTAGCISIFPINDGKTLFGRTKSGLIYEVSLAWEGSTDAELLSIVLPDTLPSIDILYALKMSHRYKKNSPHFLKTMRDIHELRRMGAQIPDYLMNWYKRREKETYDYSHPNLNQSKTDFFAGDGVTYVYDHDSLHEAVALHGAPVYKQYQKDGSEVLCDKSKWDALPNHLKQDAVYEEACVLALERSLIPHPGVFTPLQAFELALMKVCTSITSGWFREFAWENYWQVRDIFINQQVSLLDRLERGIENGTVRTFQEKGS